MNDRERERALRRDLRDLAGVRPEAGATARAIERARAAVQSTTSNHVPPRKKIMTLRNVGAIAAALLAMALLKHWITPERETGFAFGAVQKEVEKAKSVQYHQVRKDIVDGKVVTHEKRKVMILGPHQIREEVETTSVDDPLPEGQIRLGAVLDKCTMINNAKTGKSIALYPDKKAYDVPKILLGIDPDTDEVKETKIEPTPNVDFYNRIREFPSDSATKLPDRKIDGKRAIGFQTVEKIKHRSSDDSMTRTYWIDPETKLPVRIEAVHESVQGKSTVRSEWLQRDIIFDAPLDEALFSTEPPKDYKERTRPELRKEVLEKSKLEATGVEEK